MEPSRAAESQDTQPSYDKRLEIDDSQFAAWASQPPPRATPDFRAREIKDLPSASWTNHP